MKHVRTVVLDTNVLLSVPEAINDFPDALVVIPDTVLSEIDKLKTARVDAELRFKGREISRLLFELSERGNLQDGVEMDNGGRLRVGSATRCPPMLTERCCRRRSPATLCQRASRKATTPSSGS